MLKLLSIIIPVYNIENHIGNCLDSILDQPINQKHLEVILVNDGSEDQSLKICNQYASRHSNIVVLDIAHVGIGGARNAGLKASTGTYIYFLDGDDYLAADTLQQLTPHLEKCIFEIVGFRSKRTRSLHMRSSEPNTEDGSSMIEGDGIWHMANNQDYKIEVWWYVIKKSFLEQFDLKFESNRFVNDSYFTPNTFYKASAVLFIPTDIHRYVFRKGSITKTSAPAHLKKHIADTKFAIGKMNEIIFNLEKSENKAAKKAIEIIAGQKFKYSFFSIVRLIRANGNPDDMHALLEDLKAMEAYPIKTRLLQGKISLLGRLFNVKQVLQLIFSLNGTTAVQKILKFY